jgi:hypothetical protein
MSDHRDEKLESMLRSRRQEAPRPDLAERIILRAQTTPQRQDLSLWRFVRDLCAEFHLPKPAYVLAGALAVGIVVGYSAPSGDLNIENCDAVTAQYSPFADEELL